MTTTAERTAPGQHVRYHGSMTEAHGTYVYARHLRRHRLRPLPGLRPRRDQPLGRAHRGPLRPRPPARRPGPGPRRPPVDHPARHARGGVTVPAKLSKTMSEALDKARQHGALVRIPGGFWTFPGCPTTRRRGGGAWGDYDSPDWSVAVGTARSLVRRGLLDWSEYAENGSGSFPVAATPTDPPKEN